MRLDNLLWRLRLAKTRPVAQETIAKGHIRVNRRRITKRHHIIAIGDIITIPTGANVRTLEILALPQRRGPASEAQSHYRIIAELTPSSQTGFPALQNHGHAPQ